MVFNRGAANHQRDEGVEDDLSQDEDQNEPSNFQVDLHEPGRILKILLVCLALMLWALKGTYVGIGI